MRTEDGYIIHKCLNGEPEAFGLLVDKYKASIYAFAYTKLRDFRDAEDVTQEAFIQAYQKLRTLRRWDSFLAWLYVITFNRCKNLIRSRCNRPDREFIEDQDHEDLVSPSMDSYRESLALESIREALDSLPETYSQALTLHYFGGMTCKEIAIFLRTSPVAIKKRLSRARSQLKEEVLAMMSTTYGQQKLGASFTFRIVEMVKRIKIHPVPRMPLLPWGLSLGTGIIFTILSFYPGLLPPIEPIMGSMSSSLPAEARVSDTGQIPIDMLKTSEIPFLASQQGSSDGENATLLAASQAEGGTWTRRTDMATGRSGLSTVAVNGKIYAIGGTPNGTNTVATVEEYDPITNTWARKADMLAGRRYISTIELNGRIYAIGGEDRNVAFSTVQEYDPVTDRWIRKADMPTARFGLSVSAVNGRIYAIGGVVDWDGPFLSTVEEYDPVADTWRKKADMPTPRGGLSTCVVNGKIYAIGGSHQWHGVNDYTALSTVEKYDPATDTWRKKADMPTARLALSIGVLHGKIFAIGGIARSTYLPTVEEYDPVTDTWTKRADMPTTRAALSASVVNGKIYAIGGVKWPTFYSIVEEYTPEGWEQPDPAFPQ